MHNIEIPDADVRFTLPESFDEMTTEQFIFTVTIFHSLVMARINVVDFYNIIIAKFIGIEKEAHTGYKTMAREYGQESVENYYSNIVSLHPLLEYILTKDEATGGISFNYKSVTNKIPQYHNLIGPKDAMMDCSFGEWIVLNDLYREYQETNSLDTLNVIVGTMYRDETPDYELAMVQPSFDGNRRVPFNKNLTEIYAKRVEKWDYSVKYAMLLFLINCINFMHEGEILLHGRKISFTKLFTPSEGGSKSNLGSTGLAYKVAETGIFGTIKDTLNENVYNVYLKMLQWNEEYEEFTKKK
jgi:hypothetical protein